ncbi:MAG: FAD:protein FMN transferase [Rhodospirillaceae bacterium]
MTKPMTTIGRRRFLGISAATAGLALLPFGPGPVQAEGVRVWRGSALGADACIQLHHPDSAEAERLIALCVTEVERLEAVFSLYRPDSALSRLNRTGELVAPPLDLVRLLSESAGFSARTGGAFDPTVQPLWQLYAGHFATPGTDPDGPSTERVQAALARVGWREVRVDSDRIALARPGMALTLNGIAQGYITDRVIERLRAAGVERVLADLGETRTLGRHPDGTPWRVGLENPFNRGTITGMLDLENQAISTSGGYGTVFEPAGRFNHLFDPASGRCAERWPAVSVVAETATTADALSTAFCFLPLETMRTVLARTGGSAHVSLIDGGRIVLKA